MWLLENLKLCGSHLWLTCSYQQCLSSSLQAFLLAQSAQILHVKYGRALSCIKVIIGELQSPLISPGLSSHSMGAFLVPGPCSLGFSRCQIPDMCTGKRDLPVTSPRAQPGNFSEERCQAGHLPMNGIPSGIPLVASSKSQQDTLTSCELCHTFSNI